MLDRIFVGVDGSTRGRGGFARLRVGGLSNDVTHRTTPLAIIAAEVKPGVGRVVVGLEAAGVTVDTRLVETDRAAGAPLEVAAEVNAQAIVIGTQDFGGYWLLRLGGSRWR